MTFTDATILTALAALAVPLVIHLLGRRRARIVQLPTMRFAEGAHLASRGRRWLKSASLLAARLAAVALLVLALAGPYLATGEYTGGSTPTNVSPAAPPPVYSGGGKDDGAPRTAAPLRVLIVDAAGQEAGRLRSADLVAATFAYDAIQPGTSTEPEPSRGGSPDPPRARPRDGAYAAGQVEESPGRQTRRATVAQAGREALAAADVIFWVGPQAPADTAPLAEYLARGGAVVWVPGNAPQPPEAALAAVLGVRVAVAEEVADGITLDPGGYTSDLVAAFEGGTGGDLGAPVFRRRLTFTDAPAALAFRDGRAAAVEGRVEKGRTLVLAAGPGPAWGDLAGRAEFVVLMHSLAEAVAPAREHASSAPREHAGGHTSEGTPSAPPLVYSQGAKCDKATAQASITPLAPWLALALVVMLALESVLAALGLSRPARA